MLQVYVNHNSQFPEQTLGSSLSGFVHIAWPTQKIQPCYPSTPVPPPFWSLASPLLEFSSVINILGNLWQQLYSYHCSELCVFCHGLVLLDFLSQSTYTLWYLTALVSAFTKRLWGLTYSSLYAIAPNTVRCSHLLNWWVSKRMDGWRRMTSAFC